MIKLEKTEVHGWEPSIRGMRNPKNSWHLSDTNFDIPDCQSCPHFDDPIACDLYTCVDIGPNDRDLMMRLANGGPVHAKYRRMIVVWVDITAPLYWWKEFDTYKVGTVANSCSTMHKIHDKEFVREDFSCEDLIANGEYDDAFLHECFNEGYGEQFVTFSPMDILDLTIKSLNANRNGYLICNEKLRCGNLTEAERKHFIAKRKVYWKQMIQLLPSSYNQKRTIMLNYEVLTGIYPMRKDHKLQEWHTFCDWVESLPYSEVIVGERNEKDERDGK